MDAPKKNLQENLKTSGQNAVSDIAYGSVIEALPNTLFRVEIDGTGVVILAYLAGKMRMNRIRVLIGDRVEMKLDSYGGRARIVKRL